jgi:hypothetical protein
VGLKFHLIHVATRIDVDVDVDVDLDGDDDVDGDGCPLTRAGSFSSNVTAWVADETPC